MGGTLVALAKVLAGTAASGGALGKLSVMWQEGVYLGVKGKSGEILVATEDGVWKTRSVQRRPFDDEFVPNSIGSFAMGPKGSKGLKRLLNALKGLLMRLKRP